MAEVASSPAPAQRFGSQPEGAMSMQHQIGAKTVSLLRSFLSSMAWVLLAIKLTPLG